MSQRPNEKASNTTFEFEALRHARNYRNALIEEFRPCLQGRVLEIGAGIGQFTEELVRCPEIREIQSVEPEAGLARQFSLRLPGQKLVCGTVEAVPEEASWDAIVCVNVLEHIQEDEKELGHYARRLSGAHGRLCLFVPARKEIYAPLDRDFGHHRRYHLPELRHKLEAAGFEVMHIRYYNWLGYFAWWLGFCVLKKKQFNPGAVQLYDRLFFPFVHWSETRICRPPFGQSLLAIARIKSS